MAISRTDATIWGLHHESKAVAPDLGFANLDILLPSSNEGAGQEFGTGLLTERTESLSAPAALLYQLSSDSDLLEHHLHRPVGRPYAPVNTGACRNI
jgi:hypothetical protein